MLGFEALLCQFSNALCVQAEDLLRVMLSVKLLIV